ncbi:MAG: dihydropteroate synthase [Limnochordales bacterium]
MALRLKTWEAYTPAAARRVLSDLGMESRGWIADLPPGAHHVAFLQGGFGDALAWLAAAVEQRGGLARRLGDAWVLAASLGTWWHGLATLRAPGGPPGGGELARQVAQSLAADGGSPAADMPCRDLLLPIGRRTAIMGVLNVTPDSFSDGGRHLEPRAAVARAREMVAQGADVLDIGGESTRPGARPVAAAEELERVLPVVEQLAGRMAVPISIDTTKAAVARQALAAGAHIINDISALRFDPEMAAVAAAYDAPVVLMHMQGTPADMQANPVYQAVVPEILDFLDGAVARAVAAGIRRERILVDPGIGFGKNLDHNLQILRELSAFRLTGCPVLLGPSRKTFIGQLLHLPPGERVEGTGAAVALGIAHGAAMVRVHDVEAMRRTARVADAIVRDYRPVRAFLSLGANVGDPVAQLREAVDRLGRLPGTRVVRCSSVYRTAPVGPVPQDWFFNLVVEVATDLDPVRLVKEGLRIEAEMGRERRVRWGPRLIDIDLMLYGDETVDRPDCRVPHPESHRRRFVLAPLVELDPAVRWRGRSAAEHLAQLPAGQAVEAWGPLAPLGQGPA